MSIYRSRLGSVDGPDLSITDYVLRGLQGRTDQPVLTCGVTGRSLTGAALERDIRALAGGLAARGPGLTVALMAPNMPQFAVVFHAVALAGGTITTINPAYTADEVRHQLLDAGASLLITVPDLVTTARTASEGTGVTEIAVIGQAVGATPLSALMGPPLGAQVPVDLDRHSVVLPYSSGTTGLPKGVMLSHRNLVVNLLQSAALIPVAPGETTLAVLPYFHIYGMQVVMNFYLAQGASVVTLPRFDLPRFLELVQAYRMERLFVVPPVMIALAHHPLVAEHDLSSVRMVMSAAAPMGETLSEAVAARLGCTVIQGYGMTETSPVATVCPDTENRPGAAGILVASTEARLIDPETGADAAPGGEGELWLRGPQIMQGYLNRPDATAQTIDADGWLHTGDIARFAGDGYLFIVDRLKELIKFKGFQVAPAELEALLITHPDITDVAVLGQPDDEAGEVPVAFVVGDVTLDEVRKVLEGHVASYKQIHRVIRVEAIPKSASGKILRRILRERL